MATQSISTREWAHGFSPQWSRIVCAVSVGILAAALHVAAHARFAYLRSDFSPVWFGAKVIWHGGNPYALVGPGRVFEATWNLFYPATAMVAATPLMFLAEAAASSTFVFISAAVLFYVITADGWHRTPLFLSAAFIDAAAAGQWSPLVTAALLSPALAWLVVAKPNYAVLLLATVRSRQTLVIAVVGGTLLLVISVALAPHWPEQWLATLTTSGQFAQPILLSGGFLILLALLRWRRPEARLILALAIVPQTFYWYETLPLMLVPATLRQSLALSLVSSCGFLIERGLLMQRFAMTRQEDSALLIALVYLPCVLLVLQRRNEGELPFWVRPIVTRYRSWRNHPPGASNSPTG